MKGSKPRLRQKEQHARPAYGDAAPNQLRQRQRLLGRLMERDRCRGLGMPDSDMRQLLKKIHRHPNFQPDQSVGELKEEIHHMTIPTSKTTAVEGASALLRQSSLQVAPAKTCASQHECF